MAKISIIGTGYVGLVSGTCLADFGHKVWCIDIDQKRIDVLNKGEIPIYEPGLKEMVRRNVEGDRLSFSTELKTAVQSTDVVFIAVGTPSMPDGGTDMSYVISAAKQLASCLDDHKVIVQKSTSPVGSARSVAAIIKKNAPAGLEFDIVSNPEFLREGSAIEDFMRPNRVVIGTESDHARQVMKDVYRPLYLLETPILFTTLETAELIKYASNAYLATKISFINEIAEICEHVGALVDDVAKGMGLDGRIGSKFLHAGIGYGGSCLPKDVSSLIHAANQSGAKPRILSAVHEVNQGLVDRAMEKLGSTVGSLQGKTIGLLGLSFKPNTDDLREAPSLKLVQKLISNKATIKAFDPIAADNFKQLMPEAVSEYCKNAYDTAEDCDAIILLTEWNEFRELDFDRLKTLMRQPVFIDCRNVYKGDKIAAKGFRYESFGRGSRPEAGK